MINGQTLEEEVNEPKHYRSHESGIEAIEVTRWLQFDLGNCWKYCMRYRDKGTPKKDLMKAKWYIEDFREHFIDYNNESMFIHRISEDIIEKMCKITEAEPNEKIRHIFEQLMIITTQNCIMDIDDFNDAITGLDNMINAL